MSRRIYSSTVARMESFRRIANQTLAIGLAALAAHATAHAAIYDVARDFSPTNNPNGVWTYGSKSALGAELLPFKLPGTTFTGGVPIEYWLLLPNLEPVIYFNGTTNTASAGVQLTLLPGTIWLISGNDVTSNAFGVVRFTVPAGASGSYLVEADVRPAYDGDIQGDTDFHVLQNGTELFGRFLAPADRAGYTNTLSLAAGDTVDFLVGRGQDNSGYASGLKTQVRIGKVDAPPMPPSPADYILSRDFSPTNNPNGVWSYGAKTNMTGGFAPYAIRGSTSLGGVPIAYWQLVEAQEPTIYCNTTSSTASFGSILTIPPGTVWMFGGINFSPFSYGAVRFKVPAGAAGRYLLETDVAPAYDGGPQGDTDYHVVRNSEEIFGQFLAPTERTGYTNVLLLAAGDTIDFLVGRGQDNSNVGSGLKTRVRITQVPTPPSTDSYNLAGDFSPTNNPNGVWSYGAKPNFNGSFSAFEIRGLNPFEYWQLLPGQEPTIYRNGTSETITIADGQGVFPPGTTFLYSGTDGATNGFGVVRFVVPVGGSSNYFVKADVRPVYDGNIQGDTDFHVVKNGAELFGRFLAPSERVGYTNVLVLAAGDVVDFMVGRGQDNSGSASGLKIDVAITPTNLIQASPAGLVANGSFELGLDPGVSSDVSAPNSTTITGWTVETASVDYIGSRWTAGDGVRCLDLSGTDAATISQMITGLTPGQHYRLAFLMAANPEVGAITARLNASIGGASQEYSFVQSGFSTANLGWTEKTLDFTASASQHKLSFVSLNPGWAGAALDHVAIVAVTNDTPHPPVVVTHNLGRDFALTNPNGPWSYGYQSAIGAPFNLLDSHQTVQSENGLPILLWHTQTAPAIYANTNTATAISGGEAYPPNIAWCYAGPEGSSRSFAVMRFTVPANEGGVYLIASAVAPRISSGGDDSDYHVAKNGSELFGQFLGATESGGYTNSVELLPGDTIDFLVGRGANGRLYGSGLKIQATITRNATTPPPLPSGLVANGSFELGLDPGVSSDVAAPNSTTITGWRVETASVDYIGSRWIAGDGVRCLDLSGTDAATISQMISGLTPGQHYRLSFLMAANPEVGAITARLNASIGGASQEYSFVQSGFSTANLGWTEKTLDFTASASQHKLSFVSLNPGWAGAALDHIAIAVNPNPPSSNHAPVAKAMAAPLFTVWPDQTNLMVIAVDGLAADIRFDASLSSDADNDALAFLWSKDDEGTPFAAGVMTTNAVEVGAHSVVLLASDAAASGTDTLWIEVITLEDAVDEVYWMLLESDVVRKDKRPLLTTLDRVWNSFDDGRLKAGVRQLEAFQKKVHAQVSGRHPALARRLIGTSQQIIDAVESYLEQNPAEPPHGGKGDGKKK